MWSTRTLEPDHGSAALDWSNATLNGTDNSTDAFPPFLFDESPLGVRIVGAFFMVLIMVSAIVGNVLVIHSVRKFEQLRTVGNAFLASLATADLSVAMFVMPPNFLMEVVGGRWLLGSGMCYAWFSADVLFSTASILNLCCVSIDRLLSITKPFDYDRIMSRRTASSMLIGVWAFSICISIIPIQLKIFTTPRFLFYINTNSEFCVFLVNWYYVIVSSCISFWIPGTVMVAVYIRIAMIAYKKLREMPMPLMTAVDLSQPDSDAEKRRLSGNRWKRERKAARTLGIIMGCFIMCWLGFFVHYMVFGVAEEVPSPGWLVQTFLWFGYLNSSLNPVIYCFFHKEFRAAFKKLLKYNQWRRRRRQNTQVRRNRPDYLGTELGLRSRTGTMNGEAVPLRNDSV